MKKPYFVDNVSMREVLDDGTLGPELLSDANADSWAISDANVDANVDLVKERKTLVFLPPFAGPYFTLMESGFGGAWKVGDEITLDFRPAMRCEVCQKITTYICDMELETLYYMSIKNANYTENYSIVCSECWERPVAGFIFKNMWLVQMWDACQKCRQQVRYNRECYNKSLPVVQKKERN